MKIGVVRAKLRVRMLADSKPGRARKSRISNYPGIVNQMFKSFTGNHMGPQKGVTILSGRRSSGHSDKGFEPAFRAGFWSPKRTAPLNFAGGAVPLVCNYAFRRRASPSALPF